MAAALAVTACSGRPSPVPDGAPPGAAPSVPPTTVAAPPTSVPSPAPAPPTTAPPPPAAPAPARPAWLGTRPLPLRPDGLGEVRPTPPELVDRRLPPPTGTPSADISAPPTVAPVPADVAARSTWDPACPVALEYLRLVTTPYWGFDGRAHLGELLVHRDVAHDIAAVFARLAAARFPIEEIRITRPDELGAHPTGDGNVTGAFVCRPVTGGTSWSEHAWGRAVDVNPFHNPYVRGDAVVPELASAYADRRRDAPGMVRPGGEVVDAFAAIGWGWGGTWRSSKDWMHFSVTGR